VFYSGGEVKQYSVKKQDSKDSIDSCDGSPKVDRQTAAAMGGAGKLLEKR
jgi:hypothetical protein